MVGRVVIIKIISKNTWASVPQGYRLRKRHAPGKLEKRKFPPENSKGPGGTLKKINSYYKR